MIKKLLFGLVIIGAVACSPGDSGLKKGAVSGYDYKFYLDEEGPKAKIGDQVYFNMDILDDKDSLLQSYRNQKILPSMKILGLDDVNRKQNAIIDILAEMSLGDSVGLRVPIDSVKGLPPGFEDVVYLEYRLVAEEILTEDEQASRIEEIKAEQDASVAAMQAERVNIEALAQKSIKDYKANRLDIEETPNGTKYHIHEMGTGTQPTVGMMATMRYYGALVSNGEHFDDSYRRGRGYPFRLGQPGVIEGWQDAAINFPQGTKASVFIPADRGYGATGSPPSIPGGAELYFYMEVEELLY